MKENRSFPHRPFLTPVFTTALLFWGSCALVFTISQKGSSQISFIVSILGIGLCLLFVFHSVKRGTSLAFLAVAVLLAGGSLASAEAYLLHTWTQTANLLSLDNAQVLLLQDPSDSGYLPQALSIVKTKSGETVLALVSFPEKSGFLCGETLFVKGSIKKADYQKNDYAWRNGVTHYATVTKARKGSETLILRLLITFRSKALEALGSDDADWSVLQALVCGYRANIKDTPLYSSYQSCGLAHLVAVSGAHLVIVTGFASLLLKHLRAPRKLTVFLLVILMCLYVIIAGVPLSALRAAIMSSIGIFSYIAKRRPSSLNALGMGIYGIVVTSPHSALSASFALSALSAMGIIVFAPLVQRAIEHILPARIAFFASPLALTFSAALPAQLYSCALFSQLPLISPLSNLVCAPFFPLCCGLGLLGVLLSCAGFPFSFVILGVAHLCVKTLDWMVVVLDGIPYGTVPISINCMSALMLSLAICTLTWFLWERAFSKQAILCVAVMAVVISCATGFAPKPDCIAMLDVGQGDSFLIRSCGSTLLIDTGNKDSQLLDQLARMGVFHLDGVLITHSDDDHCGSLDALSRAIEVEEVFVAQDMITNSSPSCQQLIEQAQSLARNVDGLQVGDCLHIGKFTAEVLWPYSFQDDGGNADSLVLIVYYDANDDGVPDIESLFTGDAEHDQIEHLIEEGALGVIDILKVGHHGSANSLTRNQMLLLNPAIALIGVGENNRYGHPTQEIIDLLEEVHARVFRSDEDGGVVLTFKNDHILAHQF